ncbi:hypothetical protein [Desulfonispora thiosulfatigenes]|uniref:hypothetical protein n=1 Tax=Desulfonispora thiosulfatigenes TaxID=83661 RepID=UPI001A9A3B15|nr:hypothetical protein [Desulfonispora thiosulfatigenes]
MNEIIAKVEEVQQQTQVPQVPSNDLSVVNEGKNVPNRVVKTYVRLLQIVS